MTKILEPGYRKLVIIYLYFISKEFKEQFYFIKKTSPNESNSILFSLIIFLCDLWDSFQFRS